MRLIALALLLIFAAGPASAQQPAPSRRMVALQDGMNVAVTVNGQPLRLRVDPGLGLVLNPAAAQRIGLRGSMLAASVRIGPVRLRGDSKVARLRIGVWEGRRRFFWFDRDVVEGADGTIGIADLPEDEIVLELAAAQPGEVQYVFPVRPDGMLGLTHAFRVGTQDADMRFSFLPSLSQVTAALGAILAESQGGSWTGEPSESLVTFGVLRPLRPMRFERPLLLAGYPIAELGVRTSDWRGDHALPTAEAADADPSEMVVTGERRGMRALYRMMIGRDRLSRCSSLTYSRPRRQVVLSCRPD